jgi:hypothetical protein
VRLFIVTGTSKQLPSRTQSIVSEPAANFSTAVDAEQDWLNVPPTPFASVIDNNNSNDIFAAFDDFDELDGFDVLQPVAAIIRTKLQKER